MSIAIRTSRLRVSPPRHVQSMRRDPSESPLRIRLDDERRSRMLDAIKQYFADNFDEDISDFRADGLLDFFVAELGPPVYNQAVRDACGFFQEKLADLEGEVYEPERPAGR
ncbi:MAG: DUF2164 family protein [Gemmatimonas sp.]|nr:DUF2164 family protein [Gemmatimonas sp.]